jgi:hypothetical protein
VTPAQTAELEIAMIGRIVFGLALMFSAGAAAAQDANCTLYKVDTSLLNISKDPGGNIFNDALFDGDVACVTRLANINGIDWGFIAYKLEGSARTPVEGWSSLQYLRQMPGGTPSTGAASTTVAPAAPAAPPATARGPAPAPATPGAPQVAAAPPAGAATAIRPEDVLRFDQPIPFGAYPVNGHSIAEMIDSIPLFPPIEDLPDELWKKKCTNCHQWNQARLCEQAGTYVKAPRYVLRVPHPFGGTLKLALMRWAKSGCQ